MQNPEIATKLELVATA